MPDNKVYQKNANIALVMQSIRVNKEISRINISRELKLDRSTITNIATKLLQNELIIEKAQGTSDSKGGRKPVLIGINPDFGLILGLEIQVNIYRATLMTIDGYIIWKTSGPVNNDNTLQILIKDIYKSLKRDISKETAPLIGVGIAIPGHIDPMEGAILASCPFKWDEEITFDDIFDIPYVIDNDANCCAWGVLEIKKDKGLKNFLYSIVETHDSSPLKNRDIGFGIVINGELYYGNNFSAGELGSHNICIEDDYSYFKQLFDKLSLFISFLNPSHLFLGGEFIKNRELIERLIKENKSDFNCEIVFSELEEFEVAYGAASMFIERLFKIPGIDGDNSHQLSWEQIMDISSGKRDKKKV